MAILKIKSNPKPENEDLASDVAMKLAAAAELSQDDIPLEKEEQARAVSIERLTKTDKDILKILTELSIAENAGLIKMATIDNLIHAETGQNSILNDVPLEYVRLKVSKDRKGRSEIVDIARARQDENIGRFQALRQMFGRGER